MTKKEKIALMKIELKIMQSEIEKLKKEIRVCYYNNSILEDQNKELKEKLYTLDCEKEKEKHYCLNCMCGRTDNNGLVFCSAHNVERKGYDRYEVCKRAKQLKKCVVLY